MNITRTVVPWLVGTGLIFPCLANGQWLCWSAKQAQQIQCAQTDGSQRVNLLSQIGTPMGVAFDAARNTLYWVEREPDMVRALDLSGAVVPTTIAQLGINTDLRGMDVDSINGKVYWVAENLGVIQRADLDGANVENLAIPPGSYWDVAVDEVAGQLYWTTGPEIWRGNLDGSSAIAIVNDADQPYYLALDTVAGKVYWTDFGSNEIGRANLDGSERELPGPISGLLDRPVGVIVDSSSNKLYWTLDSGKIQRANLDGTGVETILENLESTWDIIMVPSIPEVGGSVPSVSGWGLVTLALLVLTGGTISIGRRSRACY